MLSPEDKKLLQRLQDCFPVAANPYAVIGAELGMDEQEVLSRVARLKEAGYIRRIGPIFNSGALGYVSTLVALDVPPEKIDAAAEIINRYTGVTHNYVRSGRFNIWFTFTASSSGRLEAALQEIRGQTEARDMLLLPSARLFKVNVHLPIMEG